MAGLSVLTLLLPIVSSAGQARYSFRNNFNEPIWSVIWPILIANLLLVIAALTAKAGRTAWLSVAAGIVMGVSAVITAGIALNYGVNVGLQDAGLANDQSITPHIGMFTGIGTIGASIALVIVVSRGALTRTRGTVPMGLNFIVAGAAAWVFVVMSKGYFSGIPIWSTDFMWMNLATAAIFIPLGLTVVLPLVAQNSDATGISTGYAFAIAGLFLATFLADTSGTIGITSADNVGLAVLVMFGAGAFATARWSRSLIRLTSTQEVIDVEQPQRSVAIGAVIAAVLVLALAASARNDSSSASPLSGISSGSTSSRSLSEYGRVSSGSTSSHYFRPSADGLYVVNVSGDFDSTLDVYVNSELVATNDDYNGYDPQVDVYLYAGDNVMLVVSGYEFEGGNYHIQAYLG